MQYKTSTPTFPRFILYVIDSLEGLRGIIFIRTFSVHQKKKNKKKPNVLSKMTADDTV